METASDPDRLAWLRLARSRNVGPASFQRLLKRFGGAGEALDALPEIAAKGGASKYTACSLRQGEEELRRANAVGAAMICLGDRAYPARLAEIVDPPPFIWALGDRTLIERDMIAVVGARNASSLGLAMARRLAADLGARGYVVASGFARGVDAAAHKATLDTGAVAVMAGGVDHIYPKENAALHAEMIEKGLILSEAPIGLAPQGRHFPRRNRIVSGLSRGVALIEAAARSGSLITARLALEQGREAMAVPGSPLDARADGCNELIRAGAALIRNADDVEEALAAPRTLTLHEEPAFFGPSGPDGEAPADLSARARALLGPSPVEIDVLARDLSVHPAHLAEALMDLEIAGVVERRAGGLIALRAEAA